MLPKCLKELQQYGYEVEWSEEERKWIVSKTIYYDDGYGFYFHADLAVIFKEDGAIEGVTVDGLNMEDVEKAIDICMGKCKFLKRFDECVESIWFEASDEEIEELVNDVSQVDLCLECKYLMACRTIIEQVEDVGYW